MSYSAKSIVRCHREPSFMDRVHLYLYFQSDKGGSVPLIQQATLPTLVEIDPSLGVQNQPTMNLRMEEAQQFMDELWRCGLRPTEGAGSAGAMAAVQAHLSDMRKLVFTEQEAAAK
jgi:hypothetical protein